MVVNPEVVNILNPVIIFLGVNILVGWIEVVGPSRLFPDQRKMKFNTICEIVVLLKGAHLDQNPTYHS